MKVVRTIRFCTAILFAAVTAQRASALQTPGPGAPAIALVGAAFDEARGRLVIVGGAADSTSAQTWEWDGSKWQQSAVSGPSPRDEPLMAYDRAHKVVVLHGGYHATDLKSDTWTWDGVKWRQVATAGPSPRNAAAMAYDSKRGKIMLFGGAAGSMGTAHHNDLWEWDGSSWRNVIPDGRAGSPPARALHALAYDAGRDRLVMAGGFSITTGSPVPYGDTWEWDGQAWHQIPVPGFGTRDHLAMVYAADRHAIVLHGGGNPGTGLTGDTWLYDGGSWTKLLSDGPPRGRHRMAYDDRTQSVLLWGGWGPKVQMAELWELRGGNWGRRE